MNLNTHSNHSPLPRRRSPYATEMPLNISLCDFTGCVRRRHHPTVAGSCSRSHSVPSRDQTSERQTDRLMQHTTSPFLWLFQFSVRAAGRRLLVPHTTLTGARSACQFRGLKVTSWILQTPDHESAFLQVWVCPRNDLVLRFLADLFFF